MSLKKINIRNSVLILMIIVAAITRSLNINHISDWVTFTPIGAVALFAGTYFKDKWKAFLVPLLVVFISDLALNYAWLHKFVWFTNSSIVVYISLTVMVIMGMFVKKVTVINVLGVSVAAVMMHWLFADLPFFYGKGFAEYGQLLIKAIPFELPLLTGNLIFGAVLYGGFELAKSKYTVLQTNRELSPLTP
jgi:hypothetical protein